MPEMKAEDQKELQKQGSGETSKDKAKAKFFRGDELPTATIKASLTPGQ